MKFLLVILFLLPSFLVADCFDGADPDSLSFIDAKEISGDSNTSIKCLKAIRQMHWHHVGQFNGYNTDYSMREELRETIERNLNQRKQKYNQEEFKKRVLNHQPEFTPSNQEQYSAIEPYLDFSPYTTKMTDNDFTQLFQASIDKCVEGLKLKLTALKQKREMFHAHLNALNQYDRRIYDVILEDIKTNPTKYVSSAFVNNIGSEPVYSPLSIVLEEWGIFIECSGDTITYTWNDNVVNTLNYTK